MKKKGLKSNEISENLEVYAFSKYKNNKNVKQSNYYI